MRGSGIARPSCRAGARRAPQEHGLEHAGARKREGRILGGVSTEVDDGAGALDAERAAGNQDRARGPRSVPNREDAI